MCTSVASLRKQLPQPEPPLIRRYRPLSLRHSSLILSAQLSIKSDSLICSASALTCLPFSDQLTLERMAPSESEGAMKKTRSSVVLAGGHPRSASTDVLDRAVIGNDSRDYSEVSAWLLKLRPRLVGQL